jgi:uncharacterized membrane protein YfcA
MIAGIPASSLLVLMVIALLGGVGITAVGPGGIFVTIALYALTDLPPAVVVGTASATFVATGVLGTASYYRSGELEAGRGARAAAILSGTGLAGALVGVRLNALVDEAAFRSLLGAFVFLTGVFVLYRYRYGGGAGDLDTATARESLAFAGIGGFVGVSGGLLGIGGPVLAVPLLVAAGVPMLLAVGTAQAQSIFVAAFATVGYVARDAVSWPLAVAIGVPELIGVVLGWRVAQSVDAERLTRVLAALMLVLGAYLLAR